MIKINIFVSVVAILSLSFAEELCQDNIIDTTFMAPPDAIYKKTTENFTIVELDNSTGAKCLDGSNFKYFYSPGIGVGVKKFMFFLAGGGYCGYENLDMLTSCLQRTKTEKGSSLYLGLNGTILTTNSSWGYFSSIEESNPYFWNWNKIYMLYCDGTLYQGFREEPINYNGTDLWFRGYNNTFATFEHVRKHFGLFEAEEIIMSGASSGAHASLLWMPFLKKYLPARIKLSGISDAGLFLDTLNLNTNCFAFRHHLQIITNVTNSYELDVFASCKYKKNKEKFYLCFIPEYIAENIDVPMFIINSQNDYEFMRTAYGLTCLVGGLSNCLGVDDINQKITQFREEFLRVAFKLKTLKPTWGFWSRRCLEHFYINSEAWEGNFTVFDAERNIKADLKGALYEWYLNKNAPAFIDLDNWQTDCPSN